MSCETECPESVDENFEICYTEFYKDALKSIYDFKNPQMRLAVNESLKKLRKIKHSERDSDAVTSEHMDYSLQVDRCAYIYQYGILYSKMISFHFKEFLEENIGIQKKLSKMKNLRICCLGGGAAIEAVAVVKVINDLVLRKASKAKEALNLEITIVDKCCEWKTDSLQLFKIMTEQPSLKLTNEMNIHADFLLGNVLHPFDDILEKRMKKAHFVTMVKRAKDVQQLFPETSSAMIKRIVKNITDCMGVGGCFFVVDNGGGGIPQDSLSVFKKNSLWKNIYCPVSHMTHTLESDTVKKLAKLLPGCHCSRETKVFSNVWIKTEVYCTKIVLKGDYSDEKLKRSRHRKK